MIFIIGWVIGIGAAIATAVAAAGRSSTGTNLKKALARIAAASRTRVGPATSLEANAYVPIPPAALAAQAGVELEAYSLARNVESEEGSGQAAVLLAVAEVGRNRARAKKLSITDALTRDNTPGQSGFYGRQAGRSASTAQDPLPWQGGGPRGLL